MKRHEPRRMGLMVCISLLCGGSACDNGLVRGAGSIDVPRESLKTYPTYKADTKAGRAEAPRATAPR